MPRLFVAVWPPEHVVEAIGELRRKDQRGVRFVPPDNWHVTLRFLGEAGLDEAASALDQCVAAGGFPARRVHLGPAVDVLNERALIVPVSGIDELAAEVAECTRDVGTEAPKKRFVGHLTLARVKPTVAMPATLGSLVSTEFEVREIALVLSTLRPEGARYDTVATWPTSAVDSGCGAPVGAGPHPMPDDVGEEPRQ